MAIIVLGAKAVIAVLLVAAGAAKLADLPGFTAGVALFAPRPTAHGAVRAAALCVAAGEIVAGAASWSSPEAGWLNLVVLAIGCGFVAVAAAGYAWHRGQSCRCFGALPRRGFALAGVVRAVAIALSAAVATAPVGHSRTQVGLAGRLALLAGAAVIGTAAFSAARAAGASGAGGAGGAGRAARRGGATRSARRGMRLRWAP